MEIDFKKTLMKTVSLSVLGLFVFSSSTFANTQDLDFVEKTDELGYKYIEKTDEEINLETDNFVLISGEPGKDAVYAVYEDQEIERYEEETERTLDIEFPYVKSFSALTNNQANADDITILATPSKYSDFYSKSVWIERKDGPSLSITPKKAAYKNYPNPLHNAAANKKRWDTLYNKHKNDKKWKNTASMKGQLQCHIDYAQGAKTPWNIEPWRTETNYSKIVKAACNPKP